MRTKLLDCYIAKTVLSAIFLVSLMLAGLQIFILLVNQFGDIGRANYGIWQATIYVLLQMPLQVYLFFPMASLLGSLIGLGIMANHRELIVMRAAGMSIAQVTYAVLKSALLVIIVVTFLGETVVPKLALFANNQKLRAISGGQVLRTAKGVWLRHQNDFINIGQVLPDNDLRDIYQFHFDEQHALKTARKIERLHFSNGVWQAHGISQSSFLDERVRARHFKTMIWDVALNPNVVRVGSREPDEMNLRELNQYLCAQKKNHQTVSNYQLAYWQRILQPLTTVVMMILAIPFIFGPLRSSTMGSKLLAGATVGFGFHIINRIFGPISQVFQWPVEVAAFAPTLLFAALGLYLMRRVR